MFLILMQYNSSENALVVGFFEQIKLKGGGRVLVSTMEVNASYVKIFLHSTYDMKFRFERVITPDKGESLNLLLNLCF